jgi:hypothetical protein
VNLSRDPLGYEPEPLSGRLGHPAATRILTACFLLAQQGSRAWRQLLLTTWEKTARKEARSCPLIPSRSHDRGTSESERLGHGPSGRRRNDLRHNCWTSRVTSTSCLWKASRVLHHVLHDIGDVLVDSKRLESATPWADDRDGWSHPSCPSSVNPVHLSDPRGDLRPPAGAGKMARCNLW